MAEIQTSVFQIKTLLLFYKLVGTCGFLVIKMFNIQWEYKIKNGFTKILIGCEYDVILDLVLTILGPIFTNYEFL